MTGSVTTPLPLPARDQVQVWLLDEPAQLTAGQEQRFAAWLSDDERERWQRFHFAEDRQRFLLARALVRGMLARYCGCEPQALRFGRDEHGKPRLQHSDTAPGFNLTHTRGLCALAVSGGAEVGIDAENTQRTVEMLSLARRFFAAEEVLQLQDLPEAMLRPAFFRLWTLKEAYVKARGLGLKLGLDRFAFDLASDGQPHLHYADSGNKDDWSFMTLLHGTHRHVAVAVPLAGAVVETRVVALSSL